MVQKSGSCVMFYSDFVFLFPGLKRNALINRKHFSPLGVVFIFYFAASVMD